MIEDDRETSENGKRGDPRKSLFIISVLIVMMLGATVISLYFLGVISFNDEKEDEYRPPSFLQVILHSNDNNLWIKEGPEGLHWNDYRVAIDGKDANLTHERLGSAEDIVVFSSSEDIIVQTSYNVKIIDIENNMVVWEKDIVSQF